MDAVCGTSQRSDAAADTILFRLYADSFP
jgi:hypothetical protein